MYAKEKGIGFGSQPIGGLGMQQTDTGFVPASSDSLTRSELVESERLAAARRDAVAGPGMVGRIQVINETDQLLHRMTELLEKQNVLLETIARNSELGLTRAR